MATTITSLTNRVRDAKGLRPLSTSRRLDIAANRFSAILAHLQELSHTADGQDLTARAQATNYPFRRLGENIGWTSKRQVEEAIAADLVKRWMDSRGHRRNILERRFRDIGVGVTQLHGRTYGVQIFGTKA